MAHIQERQIKFLDRILGEDASTQLILGEWIGGMLSGAALQVCFFLNFFEVRPHYMMQPRD